MTLKTITASIALFGWAVATAQAGEPSQPAGHGHATPSSSATAPAAEARRAVRDKVTGKFRAPTIEELEAERDERRARGEAEPAGPGAPLVVRQHSSGMRSAVLGPDYMVTLKAERGPDGKLIVKHANPAHEHRAAPKQQPAQRATE